MRKLIEGIVDFREKLLPEQKQAFAQLALGQSPDALLICCSDSRVVPNLFASTNPGDVFVLRNIGNFVPACGEDGFNNVDRSEAAAIEYAVQQLKVKDVIVCGHSECGAHISLLHGAPDQCQNLRSWLRHGESALYRLRAGLSVSPHLSPHNQLSQLSVLQQLDHLRSYPNVRAAIEERNLRLHGWWFDIAQAEVFAYEPSLGRFVCIDREEGEAILQRLGH